MTCADRMSRGSGVEARRSQAACGALSPLKQDVMEEEQERREERTSDTSLSSQSTAAIVRIRSIVVVVDSTASSIRQIHPIAGKHSLPLSADARRVCAGITLWRQREREMGERGCWRLGLRLRTTGTALKS